MSKHRVPINDMYTYVKHLINMDTRGAWCGPVSLRQEADSYAGRSCD